MPVTVISLSIYTRAMQAKLEMSGGADPVVDSWGLKSFPYNVFGALAKECIFNFISLEKRSKQARDSFNLKSKFERIKAWQ